MKKALFYGRDANLASKLDGDVGLPAARRNCSGQGMDTADVADYLHGVIGLATEAGELLEGMRDVINGKPLDCGKCQGRSRRWQMVYGHSGACRSLHVGEMERTNIAKLRARFPDRFTGI